KLRIEQYFQVQDYALWDVIENGNSFKPIARTTAYADGTSTSTIPGLVTTKEKAQKKNDVKARSMLLMALPNEHLFTFSHYKDAKTLFEAVQARFGGTDATKKTQRTLLKQIYKNFNALSTESIDSIFNRLQKIVSQLAILGENISQEDLNMKFLRSLPYEWNTHVVVWRNKVDLNTMSIDDLYNNFKIVEQEVKRTVTTSSSSGSQNIAFLSSSGNTNEVDTTNIQVSTVSTPVSTVSTHDNTANLSDATVYAFLANQPNGSQLVHEDLEQIHEDDLKEIDLKWDCRSPRHKESRSRNQDSLIKTVNVEETSSKAMVTIDGAGFDRSYMADDEAPTNMALMAFLNSELDKISKEKDDLDVKIGKFENASQSLDKLIGSQITDNKFAEPSVKSYGVKPIEVVTQTSSVKISNLVKENNGAPLIKDWESDEDDEVESPPEIERKTVASSVDKARCKYHQRERMVNGTNLSRVNHNANIVPKAVFTRTGLKPINSVRPVNPKSAVSED
nr:hypothetical protein [Tanacetum cinerariifolium]